jgi:hypothetical protein
MFGTVDGCTESAEAASLDDVRDNTLTVTNKAVIEWLFMAITGMCGWFFLDMKRTQVTHDRRLSGMESRISKIEGQHDTCMEILRANKDR